MNLFVYLIFDDLDIKYSKTLITFEISAINTKIKIEIFSHHEKNGVSESPSKLF